MDLSGQLIKGTGSFEVKEISNIGNIVTNSYFESNITGAAIQNQGTGGDAVATHETTSPISGSGSLRITQTTPAAEVFRPNATFAFNRIPSVGDKFKVTFKSKLLSGSVAISNTNGLSIGGVAGTAYLQDEVFSGEQSWEVIVNDPDTGSQQALIYFYSTGAFDLLIDDFVVEQLPELPTLDKGTKYLECTSAGTVAIPSDVAYGEWEWDLWKLDTGSFYFGLMGLTPYAATNGYSLSSYILRVLSDERISLAIATTAGAYDSNLMLTTITPTHGTWYRFKVTRTLDGEFTVYIKGGEFGVDDWTLIQVAIGTNPVTDNSYTESNYMLLDIDRYDRIANLTVKNLVKQ